MVDSFVRAVRAVRGWRRPDADSERGDVPGWVLITVMTAGLVTALWVVAEPQLKAFFQSAVSAVHGP
jgi:hypothetical protein